MPRFARRAVLRALASAAVALVAVTLGRQRDRPGFATSAAAGAVLVGAAMELPAASVPAALVAAGGITRTRPRPRTAVGGMALGAGAALALRRVWPVPPRTPAQVRRAHPSVSAPPSPDGHGVTLVLNTVAGPTTRRSVADQLRAELPAADIVMVDSTHDLDAMLDRAAASDIVGVAGGDGSINAAADVARRAGKPLVVVPTGTLNHFTWDLGVETVEDALDAIRTGHAVTVETGTIDGRAFLNTASLGSYCELVDARDRLEERIGKWPALVVALAKLLRTAAPTDVELDGRRRRLWMMFIGNCTYSPPGFAPSWRERLDDGWLDVRLVDASQPFARSRLLAAVLTGRLAKTNVYETFRTRELRIRATGGPIRLARDGETFTGGPEFTIAKGAPLVVYAPPPS
jgi:diacylglycerol kinase family enzyme